MVVALVGCGTQGEKKGLINGIANSTALEGSASTVSLEEYASDTESEEGIDPEEGSVDEVSDAELEAMIAEATANAKANANATESNAANSEVSTADASLENASYDYSSKNKKKKNRKKNKKYNKKNKYNNNYNNDNYNSKNSYNNNSKNSYNSSKNNKYNNGKNYQSDASRQSREYDTDDTDSELLLQLLPVATRSVESQVLHRKGYVTSYNKSTKLPNWTMWHLTKSHTYGNVQRNSVKFHEDYEVMSPRADNNDYYNSRYDRGHMCPAGDNKWNATAMNDCFLFTNMCPQNHNLNTGAWNDLEILCRAWARKYGDIYIVCGPLLSSGQHKTVGPHKVVVPERFYKVVLRLGSDPAAIGFIYKNQSAKRGVDGYYCSVDEVEAQTGLDFFSGLKDELEKRVEANGNINKWYVPSYIGKDKRNNR